MEKFAQCFFDTPCGKIRTQQRCQLRPSCVSLPAMLLPFRDGHWTHENVIRQAEHGCMHLSLKSHLALFSFDQGIPNNRGSIEPLLCHQTLETIYPTSAKVDVL